MPRILSIDYGIKRTGIAITDEMQIIASGLTTVPSETLIAFLKDYFSKEKVEKVRDDLFEKYINSGKDNWKKNKSHFKGSYIAIDMGICGKLVEGQLNQTQ